MLSIMIVDDEVPIRQWFRFCIEKHPSDFKVVCEAGDGREALELLENHSVDIIITDIRMPKMDGIELMKAVKRKYSSIKIILLTCFEEFEYAKAAISEGAFEYLLKTAVGDKEIIEVLNNVKLVINDEPSENTYIGLYNRVTKEELHQWSLEESDELKQQPFIAIALSTINDSTKSSWGNYLHEIRFSHIRIQNWIEVSDQVLVVIFRMNKHSVQSNHLKDVKMIVEQINQSIFNIGISDIHYSYEGISKAIDEAKIAIDQRFHQQQHTLIDYKRTMEVEVDKEWIKIQLNKFLTCELKEDFKGAIKIAETIMDLFREVAYWDINYIYEITYIMLNMVKNSGYVEYVQDLDQDLRSSVYARKTFQELQAYLIITIQGQTIKNSSEHDAVKKAVEYIDENFMKQITLVEVAEYVHLNSEYFSRLFHDCMAIKFSRYLSNKRLDTALRLYNSTELKLYQIGEEVGYLNHSYFSRKFKEYIKLQDKK